MSLDSFFGAESTDGAMSADKVREFQERMARNAQQMATARQQEQKQKKKEDHLAVILLKFIQTHTRTDITLLVARCLEQNIPAVFVLSLIMLGNEEMQREMGVQLQLNESPSLEKETTSAPVGQLPAGETVQLKDLQEKEMTGALVAFGDQSALPLKMRIEIDLWSRTLWESMSPIPERLLKTAIEYNEDPEAIPEPKDIVTQLGAFVLRDYFADNRFPASFENTKGFASFLIKGLFKRLKDQVNDQKQLES